MDGYIPHTSSPKGILNCIKPALNALFTGVGQVMFQQSWLSGLVFLAGIFWGAWECGMPQVAWGAVIGTVAATAAGYLANSRSSDGAAGLWGFNGTLVGCAFPTFLPPAPLMWCALVVCAAWSTWVRDALNHVMRPWGVNSLTFPFVLLTWVFLLASHTLNGIAPEPTVAAPMAETLDTSLQSLAIYWLKGISQVFLINSWVTGLFFLVALAVSSRWAAAWAAVSSAVALTVATL